MAAGWQTEKAYEAWRQAYDKFNYFVVGASGALCAFVAQTMSVERFGFSPATVEMIALFALMASVIAGFKHLEAVTTMHKANHNYLHCSDSLDALHENIPGPKDSLENRETGEQLTNADWHAQVKRQRDLMREHEAAAMRFDARASKMYRWRNRLLLSGVVLLISARIAGAYA